MNTNEPGAAEPQPKKLPCPDSLPLPPFRLCQGCGGWKIPENSGKSVIRVHSCPFVVERVRPGLVASVFGVFTRILGDFSEGKNCRIIRNIGWAARTRLGFNTVAGRWAREESPPDFARGSGR